MHDQFRSFLLNESKHYLGQRSGDILTALQNLQEDMDGLGKRAVMRAAQGIVNQIRIILHGRWDEQDVKYLKSLQKIGVALMKSIDENDDVKEIVASSVMELEGLLDKLQMPINNLGTEDNSEGEEELSTGSELSA